jgi:HPt (histidine-containing phosphotransfer) domain-containing protein
MMIFKGMTDYIAKPIDQKELNNLLVRWLPHDKINAKLGQFEEDYTDAGITELPRALVEITELNCVEALKGMDGNVQMYMKLLHRLVDESEIYIESLYDFLKLGDLVNYAIVANGAKSLLYSVGAKLSGDVADRLEKAAEEKNIKYCQERNNSLCDGIKWLVQRVVLTLPTGTRSGAGDNENPEDSQKLAGIVQNLSFSLSKNDTDGVLKHIAALRDYAGNGQINAIIKDAEAQKYVKAAELCQQFLETLLDK